MIDYLLIAALILLVFSKPIYTALRKRRDQKAGGKDQKGRENQNRDRHPTGTAQDNNGT